MTDNKIALRELLEKGSDATFLREMIGFAAQRLMELETEARCGAATGERTPERVNQRTISRPSPWTGAWWGAVAVPLKLWRFPSRPRTAHLGRPRKPSCSARASAGRPAAAAPWRRS
jgi:hypothetical protein